jgi:hypothetical protein
VGELVNILSSSGKEVVANRAERRRAAAILRAKPVAKHNRKRKGVRKPHWASRGVKAPDRQHWQKFRTTLVYPVGPGSCAGAKGCDHRKAPLWTVELSPLEMERRLERANREAAKKKALEERRALAQRW